MNTAFGANSLYHYGQIFQSVLAEEARSRWLALPWFSVGVECSSPQVAFSDLAKGELERSQQLSIQDGLHRGVDAAIPRVRPCHHKRVVGIRTRVSGNPNDGEASSVSRRPRFGADPGQDCGSVGGTFFCLDRLDSLAIEVCLDLPPKRRAGPATAQANPLHG